MKLIDIQIAARSLLQHKKRTLFLGVATASITLLLVLMNALTDGIQDTILRTGSTLMTGHVNVGGFYKPLPATAAPLVLEYEKVVELVKRDVPELDFWVARGRGYAKAISDTQSMDLVLGGIDIQNEREMRKVIRVVDGSLDELARPNTIMLFETQQKRLGVKAGDMLTLSAPTARGINNTVDVRVAAIAKDMGLLSAFNAFLQWDTLRALYQLKEGSTGAVQLHLKDHRMAPFVAARLRESLKSAGYRVMDPDPQPYFMKLMMKVNREEWVGQKLDVSTWEDELSFMSQALKLLAFLKVLLVVVLSIIVIVGIMNTMYVAIRERTREIGTLRAIGMQRRKVAKMFLLEAMMLGLVSTLGGAAAAGLVAGAINAAHIPVNESVQMFLMRDHLSLLVEPGAVITAIVALTLLTTLAAVFPAFAAARLQPVTAMHHIG